MTTPTTRPIRKERDTSIDLVKGICIILMVAGHAMPSGGWIGSLLGMFRMPCFFIASGFLFKAKSLDTPIDYVKRKVKGLWWPFVFWSLVYLALHNIFARLHLYDNYLTISETLKLGGGYALMAGTEQLLGGFWFLSSLLFATLVGYAYYKWIGFSTKSLLIGIAVSLALAELMCVLGIEKQTIHLNSRDFTALAYFFTGTLYSRIDRQVVVRYRYPLLLAAVLFLVLQTTFIPVTISTLRAGTVLPFYITSTTAALALIQLCYITPRIAFTNAIVKIGTRTIDVLIFHFLVFKMVTAAILLIEGLPIERLSDFPVPQFNNLSYASWLWIVYTVVAVILSFYIGQGIKSLKKRCKLLDTIIP